LRTREAMLGGAAEKVRAFLAGERADRGVAAAGD
jgi:hypothetical protein